MSLLTAFLEHFQSHYDILLKYHDLDVVPSRTENLQFFSSWAHVWLKGSVGYKILTKIKILCLFTIASVTINTDTVSYQ